MFHKLQDKNVLLILTTYIRYYQNVSASEHYSTHSKDLCACRGPGDSAGQRQAGSDERLWGMLGLRVILDRWV